MNQEEYNYQAQEALQQQNLDANTTMYAPQLQEQMQQSQAILVEQTNPKKIVNDILLRLRGMEEKFDGTVVKVSKPKMNEEGIQNFWFILESHINQNVILSHLDIAEIRSLMECISDDLIDDLSLNWKKYGIEKKTDLDTINNAVLVNIYLSLKRAQGQNEKNWLSKISIENISGSSRMPMKKKESFWDKFRV